MTRYNPSLATGNTARRQAAERPSVYFWLNVPVYLYLLPCTHDDEPHTFISRTPATGATQLWCHVCGTFRKVLTDMTPTGRQHDTDAQVTIAQDQGVIRERIANYMSASGIPDTELGITEYAEHFDVSAKEIRIIMAGLSPQPAVLMCRNGRHLMTQDNTYVYKDGGPRCRACRVESERARRKKNALNVRKRAA